MNSNYYKMKERMGYLRRKYGLYKYIFSLFLHGKANANLAKILQKNN